MVLRSSLSSEPRKDTREILICDHMVTQSPIVEDVFRALSDASRRQLLDRLFKRDGQSLTELASGLAMTRFGVMKHLDILEGAGLVTTRRAGRQKLHYLNPVPIRLVYDRWVSKFAELWVAAMSGLKAELEADSMAAPKQVYVAGLLVRRAAALALKPRAL